MAEERLRLRIIEDHQKLDRIFASVQSALLQLNEPGSGAEAELLDDLREDLRFALEEMLEHFGIEEEAIFAFIKDALPDLGERIAALEQGHEDICQRTSRLRRMVAAAHLGVAELDLRQAQALVQETTSLLGHHNRTETQIFIEALGRLDHDDRARLLDALNGR